MLSLTEENYLKAIYHLCRQSDDMSTSTNEISDLLGLKPGTVTEMLRKLGRDGYILYEKYKAIELTRKGKLGALKIIRKHRLWETFLFQKLKFNWDEVHAIAEELEHIHSETLIDRLSEFLGNPKFDPHGDPIPSSEGLISRTCFVSLYQLKTGQSARITGINNHSKKFLMQFEKFGLKTGDQISLLPQSEEWPGISIKTKNGKRVNLSSEMAREILVSKEAKCCFFHPDQKKRACSDLN